MTLNPGMTGFDPQQLQAAHEVGRHIRLEIRKRPREGRLEIKYIAINPQEPGALASIANCVDTLAMHLALMHDTMFGMKGKIIQEE